jgi:hypothetical protein
MTGANEPPESLAEARLLQRLADEEARVAAEPSPAHDAVVLGAAHTVAGEIAQRAPHRQRVALWWPVSLAAALVLGIAIGQGQWLVRNTRTPAAHLTVPGVAALRGAPATEPGAPVPVERADPSVWYRYIQELVFSGQVELADEHLKRFRELHPDFVYQP